jgi:hypothetical protein
MSKQAKERPLVAANSEARRAPRSGLGIITDFPANEAGSGAKATKRAGNPSLWAAKAEEKAADTLRRRYAMLDQARRILPENGQLAACMRLPVQFPKKQQFVKVMYDSANKSSGYRGLCRCANGKLCPVCAALLGEKKREELAEGVVRCTEGAGCLDSAGGAGWLALMTLTVNHGVQDKLSDLIARFDAAYDDMRTRRGGLRDLISDWGGSGNVKFVIAWEITWSPLNGYHYHKHILVFVLDQTYMMRLTPEEFSARARVLWQEATARQGFQINEHGFDFGATRGAVADYVAKWGHEPEKRPWGAEDEASKAYAKNGRVVLQGQKKRIHLTPFQMLGLLAEGITHVYGHDLCALFREYALATKGKPQLRWSRGLRKRLGMSKEKSDAELVEEESETSRCVGLIARKQWRAVLANDARADLLLKVREVAGDFEQVRAWLDLLGVRFLPPAQKRAEAA